MSLLGWLNGDRTLLECVAIGLMFLVVPWIPFRAVVLVVERSDELRRLGSARAICLGTTWFRRAWLSMRAIIDPRDIQMLEIPSVPLVPWRHVAVPDPPQTLQQAADAARRRVSVRPGAGAP